MLSRLVITFFPRSKCLLISWLQSPSAVILDAKECSNYHKILLILRTSKVMLKILQVRLQQYVNCKVPDVQAGFRKVIGTRDQIANICWVIKKAREFQKKKTSTSSLLTMPKPFTV